MFGPTPGCGFAAKEKANHVSMIGLYLFRQLPDFILSEVEGLPHTFACSTIWPAGPSLRRFAGVSEAGARSRNPERIVRGTSLRSGHLMIDG
jgi:hypothetical protein